MTFLIYLMLAVVVTALAIQIAIGLCEFAASLALILTGAVLWSFSSLIELWVKLWRIACGHSA